jgi:hypothetical protein
VTAAQLRWNQTREAEQQRIDTLGREMWDLHNKWAQRDVEQSQVNATAEAEAKAQADTKIDRRKRHEAATLAKDAKRQRARTKDAESSKSGTSLRKADTE